MWTCYALRACILIRCPELKRSTQMGVEGLGNQDFWPTAYAVNPKGYLACKALDPLFERLMVATVHDLLPLTIGRLMAVTFKSLHAVIYLTLNGFDADAMRIARCAFENEVISEYLRLHPELVQDYNEFLFVGISEEYEFLAAHSPDLLRAQPKEFIEDAKKQIAR